MDGHARPSFLQEIWRFFKKSKQKSERTSCCVILDHNKKVERWKEGYPITSADYTQYRWRAVKGHGRGKRHTCAEGCSCQLIKEYTRAKERGDEAMVEQIKRGTYVSTGDTCSTQQHHRDVRRTKSDSDSRSRKRYSQETKTAIDNINDKNLEIQPSYGLVCDSGVNEYNKMTKHSCAEGCSCQLIKEYTRAKERGDEAMVEHITSGAYCSTVETKEEHRTKIRTIKCDTDSASGNHLSDESNPVAQNVDANKHSEKHQYNVPSHELTCDSIEKGNFAETVFSLRDCTTGLSDGDTKDPTHSHSGHHHSNVDEPCTDSLQSFDVAPRSRLNTLPSYYAENENAINQLTHVRRKNSRNTSLRRSFCRTVSKIRRNSVEAKMKRQHYRSLSGDSESDVDDGFSDIPNCGTGQFDTERNN